jgi:hypothetical protein
MTRRAVWQAVVGGLIGGSAALAVGLFVQFPRLRLTTGDLALLVPAFVAVLFFIVLVHESGHLIAGVAARLRPCLFIVGPFMLERLETGWRARFNTVFPLTGGMVGCLPRRSESLRQRMFVLVAGGPAASFVLGVGGLVLVRYLYHPGRMAGGAAIAFTLALTVAVGSLAVGLIALVPGQGHGFPSDGARLLALLRRGPTADAELALTTVAGASIAGQRPSQWDSVLVQQMLVLPLDSPHGVGARLLAYVHELDRGRVDEARRYLDDALAHRDVLPAMSRPTLLLHAASFAARFERDAVKARQLLAGTDQGALMAPHLRPLVEAAVRLAEGRRDVAELLDEAERLLKHAVDRGGAVVAAESIARLRAEASA